MRLHLLIAILAGTLIMPPILNCSPLEYSITTGLGEEYNSNVNEEANAKADWVSIASVKGGGTYESSRLKADAKVDGSYNIYVLGNRTDEFKGSGQAKANVAVVQELLFLEGEEQFRQVYTNLGRGETNPTDSTRQQTNQNTVTGRIYLTPRLTDRLATKLGYEFSAVIYNSNAQNKQINSIFSQSSYDLTPKLQLLFDADGRRQDSQSGWLERITISGGFRWEYSENGFIQAKAGPRFTRYNVGDFALNPFWEAKLTQKFSKFEFIGDTSSVYTENPTTRYDSRKTSAGGSIAWKHDRGSLQARAGYSYLDGLDTQRSEQVSLGISATYEITPRLTAKASGTREFSLSNQSTQTRWYADGSLTYELGNKFFVEGYGKWKLSDSSRGGNNSYFVNIVGLTLTKTF